MINQYSLYFLAILFIIGFFLTVFMMFNHPEFKSTLDILAGAMSSSVATIVGYFYGSSQGSKQKTEIINNKEKL